MNRALARSMLERCPRGTTPARAITAPAQSLKRDKTDEATRLAYFNQSARTQNGVVADFNRKDADA